MGTLERPEGPNGEVPSPLRPFASSRNSAPPVAPQGRSVLRFPFSVLRGGHKPPLPNKSLFISETLKGLPRNP